MFKTARNEINPHAGPTRASGRWGMLLVLALIASPLLFDGAVLCYARWMALFGPTPIVRTPVLDLVGSYSGRTADALRSLATRPLRQQWRREYAVGVLTFSLAIGSLLLRANRPR